MAKKSYGDDAIIRLARAQGSSVKRAAEAKIKPLREYTTVVKGRRPLPTQSERLVGKYKSAFMNRPVDEEGATWGQKAMVEAAEKVAAEGGLGSTARGLAKGAGETLGGVAGTIGVVADLKEAKKNRSVGPRNEVISGPLGPGSISRDFGAKKRKPKV
jgi:hypothetical protein